MFEREPGINPERALWCEVLLRTVQDAVTGVAQVQNKTTRIRICEEARRYLTTPSADLAEVCALAGMDMQAVIDRMRKQIAAAPTPEELASSRRQMSSSFAKPPAKPKEKRTRFRDQPFTIYGETRTASEWCILHGVSMRLVQNRLNNGWTPEDAFFLSVAEGKRQATNEARRVRRSEVVQAGAEHRRTRTPPRPAQTYTYKGEARSLVEWSEITGIGKNTLYARITRQGMTFAQALESPVGKGVRSLTKEQRTSRRSLSA